MICLTKVYDDGQSETLFFNRESEAKKVLEKSKAKHNKLWVSGDAYTIEVLNKFGFNKLETISSLLIISEVISEIFNKDKKATVRITRFEDN